MLKVRIIPTLLWKNHGLVKGVGFDSSRRVGTVLPAIKVYNTRQVDELILLDIAASDEEREPDYESVAEFSAECFVPLTVGGGITSITHVRNLLLAGADKVSINSAAYGNPNLVREASEHFGAQCVVVSIDARKLESGKYRCVARNGTLMTERHPVEWAREVESLGAGEILLTSIDLDGTMKGYDLDLVAAVTSAVRIPVIASGGAGNYQHMLDAVQKAGVRAIAAASIFHFTQQTPLEAKFFLSEHGLPMRRSLRN